jgi:DNA polymerase III delta prime subunit
MTMQATDNPMWSERYRPRTISDCILPAAHKGMFQKFVTDGHVPNLLLTGPPGIGKTTIAKAMLDELDADYMMINGSMNGNIETLRQDIMAFASTISFRGGRKYVILDEADYLNANSTQPALRNFMEEYSKNCGFILTCNFKNKIIAPLQSRCAVIDFSITAADKPTLAGMFMARLETVLTAESITFTQAVLAELVKKYMPDWRRCLNELQRYAMGSAERTIDAGILSNLVDVDIRDLVKAMRQKDFTLMRKWVGQNVTADQAALFRRLYDQASDLLVPSSIPVLILRLADYQYKAAFVQDAEINMAACLTEIMHDCEFK